VARAGVANYVLVPALAVALLIAFAADPMVAAGFLVLAACPGAPFGPPLAAIARGNVSQAVGLMVILAGSSAIVAPLLLQLLMPRLGASDTLRIDVVGMVATLMMTQLLPLLLGLALRHWRTALAERLIDPLELLSKILNLSLVGLILTTQFQMLVHIELRGLAAMLILLAGTLAIGWLAGPSGREGRRTMALTTSLRNVGLGLVIVTANFPGTPAVSAALAYGIIEVLGSLLLAVWWGRQGRSAAAASSAGPPATRKAEGRP
jgi:bile acid:Na+ symporter, BASS family